MRGDGHVAGVVDEIAKPMVITLLRARCGRHPEIIGRSLTPLNSSRIWGAVRRRRTVRSRDDNSRRKVQNLRGDSSPNFRTRRYHVEGEAQTLPSRCASRRACRSGRAGRDVPVLRRGHHVLDRPDFRGGQSMGRRVRTGRLIVKRTRVLPLSPGMEPTWRQSQEPQERPQRNKLSGTIHGAQNPGLGASVGQTLVRQREPRTSKQSEGKPK
jgi:hypothetical protein